MPDGPHPAGRHRTQWSSPSVQWRSPGDVRLLGRGEETGRLVVVAGFGAAVARMVRAIGRPGFAALVPEGEGRPSCAVRSGGGLARRP
ncbi:hypothetical protein ACIRSJ_29675 [Streptomyces virginiae]|uniref:hypothetical protein n=1 Tax=Streptomyces virginiae TaxID=1961 RepID=UPI003818C49A